MRGKRDSWVGFVAAGRQELLVGRAQDVTGFASCYRCRRSQSRQKSSPRRGREMHKGGGEIENIFCHVVKQRSVISSTSTLNSLVSIPLVFGKLEAKVYVLKSHGPNRYQLQVWGTKSIFCPK